MSFEDTILRGPADKPGGGNDDADIPLPLSFPPGLTPEALKNAILPYIPSKLRRYEFPTKDVPRTVPEGFQAPEQVLEGLRLIAEYLALPIGEDVFTNDADRKTWREDIEMNHPDTFAAYEHNKLRVSKIAYALSGAELILPHIEWTKLEGFGDLPAAHKEGLKQTMRLWKRSYPPETLPKLEFVEATLIPMLQHVFDCALKTSYPPAPESEV